MYIISKIASTKKIGSYNIYLNDNYSFTVGSYTLSKFKLGVSSNLDNKLIEEILICEITERLKSKLLTFISQRPRSKKEIQDKINIYTKRYEAIFPIFKNVLAHTVFEASEKQVLQFLQEYGYLDDSAFAKYIIEQRIAQGKGPLFIKQDLFSKGVPSRYVIELLQTYDFSASLKKMADKAQKKFTKEKDIKKRNQKMIRYLLSRGFLYEDISVVVLETEED